MTYLLSSLFADADANEGELTSLDDNAGGSTRPSPSASPLSPPRIFNDSGELVDRVNDPALLAPATNRDEATATRKDDVIMIVANSCIAEGLFKVGRDLVWGRMDGAG